MMRGGMRRDKKEAVQTILCLRTIKIEHFPELLAVFLPGFTLCFLILCLVVIGLLSLIVTVSKVNYFTQNKSIYASHLYCGSPLLRGDKMKQSERILKLRETDGNDSDDNDNDYGVIIMIEMQSVIPFLCK